MALSEQEIIRREALDKIRELGIDPYPAEKVEVNQYATEIKEKFVEGSTDYTDVIIAGRLMMKRIMGKASFAELMDTTGRIQIYVSRDEICPGEDKTMYNQVFKKLLDIGDFIAIRGEVFITKTGETSVRAKELTLLSKSLRPLPIVKTDAEGNIHDAFTDPELRYRQRYVDLIVNSEVRDIFTKRSLIIRSMREYFDGMG
jgi:lysyl-tRNA synthetase class 2